MNKRAQVINILRKHAALFSKPKWMTDPNWTEDEEAVNDFYEAVDSGWSRAARDKFIGMGQDAINDLSARYNLDYRNQRVDDKTAMFIDKLLELGIIDKKAHDRLLKQDRNNALGNAWFQYVNAVEENPELEKIYKNFDWDKVEDDSYWDSLEKTPYGKELQSLYEDIYNYRPAKDAPMTRKDTGSVLDATPYQLAKWKRDAKSSVLLEGLKGALKKGLQGAGVGALIGGGANTASSLSRKEPISASDALSGAAVIGVPTGLLAGAIGGISSALKARRKKLNAKYRLNEKPIG